MAKRLFVTGSSGLIGSEACSYFCARGWTVDGVDSNARAEFFGPGGDTRWNGERMVSELRGFHLHRIDIRSRDSVLDLISELRPDALIHAAAQPSHDLAARIPFDDFDTNAVGTLNLLESARRFVPESPFVFLSTNKVYGDAPNELPLNELATRWDYARPEDHDGIAETMRVDRSTHSLFGASKLAADILVQEYGRYFGMPTCCLRGGCLTGPQHAGVELHGFLSYLVKCVVHRERYRVFGYKGKQVRDNLHALDVARFIELVIDRPRMAEVYNIGGGRANSCSVIEAFSLAEEVTGLQADWEYVDEARVGDHICYITDLRKARAHYPNWEVRRDLQSMVGEIAEAWAVRDRA